jgi:hypothetical protein
MMHTGCIHSGYTIYNHLFLKEDFEMKNVKRLVLAAVALAMVATSSVSALTGTSGAPGYDGQGYNATVVITNQRLVRPQNRYAPGSARLVYKKDGGSIWYYLKNSWFVAKDYDGKNYKFYFDSNGITLRAAIKAGYKNNIVLKQINGKVYGFDTYGHCISGLWATAPNNYNVDREGKFFYFNSDGEYNKRTTQIIRAKTKFLSSFVSGSAARNTVTKYGGSVNIHRAATRYYNSKIFTAVYSATAIDISKAVSAVHVYTYDHFDVVTYKVGSNELILRVHAPSSFYASL